MSRSCTSWADDADLRRTWHAYHLIGDIIRSEQLASAPAHDAALLAAVRARLANEPVVVAPQPTAPVRPPRHAAWRMPVALAAGVMAVAGVVAVLEPSLMDGRPDVGAGPALASAPVAAPVQGALQVRLPAISRDQMWRDARVDEYLRAHRDALAGSPVALPGGAMRNVEMQLLQR